jgi:chromosomal replication initiator protein
LASPPALDIAELWPRVIARLCAQPKITPDVFASWFATLELERIDGDTAHLSVATIFLVAWLKSHYSDHLVSAFKGEIGSIQHIQITVRPRDARMLAAGKRTPPAPAALAPSCGTPVHEPVENRQLYAQAEFAVTPSGARPIVGSALDKRFVFATFLVGDSNRLTHAAAMRVASQKPGDAILFNPLYIHASVGLGKTHLLQAIAHQAHENARSAIYLTAEKFMYGFAAALKAQSAVAFKEQLRGVDILLLDDTQFLQGRATQQEFCHTLNAMIDAGHQVVIAADRRTSELESLDERVRSRLSGGLSLDIAGPDEALRTAMIEASVASKRGFQPQFELAPDVVAYIAQTIQTNGRDLDGAVNRLLAHSTLTGTPLTVETTVIAIADLVRAREPKRVKIEDIQKLVASHFNISRGDILSSRRTTNVVRPRQIAMALAKKLTLRSLPEIGRRFGGRDHTTVLHAVRKIEALCARDGMLVEDMILLERMLLE